MTKSIRIDDCNRCPECGGYTNSSLFRGEEACSQCGLVTKERAFSTSHHGKKSLLDNERITSPIKIKEYYNSNQKRFLRKNNWPDSYHKNLQKAYFYINSLCGNLGLPRSVKYNTQHLYKKVLKRGLVQGQSILGMVCACIFYSSKKNYYRSIKEIALQIKDLVGKSKNEERHVTKCYCLIVKQLKLKYQSRTLASRVPRFVSEVGLDDILIPLTTKFLEYCNAESIFNGKDPNGVVAAAIYIIGKKYGYNITQSRLAQVTSVTENTIRPRIKELETLI